MIKSYILVAALLLSTTAVNAQGYFVEKNCGYGPYGLIPCGHFPYPGPHVEGYPPRYIGPNPHPNFMGRGAPILPRVLPRYQARPWPYRQDYLGMDYWDN